MAVPRKYQFSDLVKRRLRALLGTFAIAMTSLNDMTCTAVTMIMMKRWPAPSAQKKPAIMTRVHTVRVMKLAFFFSYSDWGCCCVSWRGQHLNWYVEACQHTGGVTSSFLEGLPGSLNSDMLCEGLLARGLLALRALLCWNLTSLRGRAIVCGGAGRLRS
jgi:hypothetical protein